MELTVFDHLISLFLLVLAPIWGVWDFQKLESEVQKGRPIPRLRFYRKTLVMEWGLTAAVLALWIAAGRALPEIGLTFALADWWWLGAILTGAGVLFMIVQLVTVSRDPEKLKSMRAEFRSLRAMLPDNDRETRWFNALSVTAGICEEIIYRGFLIAYFTAFVGLIPALLLSSFVFGLGHAYQGWRGIVKVSVIGVVMGGIYLLTGSLWAPIVLHAILDITSGLLGRRAMEGAPPILEPASPLGQE
jgi:membrane protease YdiL (CAAX protease family)